MTDCDIEEPAGSSGPCCWLVPNVLHTVHVDTASSGAVTEGGTRHELTIRGLVDPEGFKRDVWAMKRGEPVDGVDGTVAPIAISMIRDTTRPPTDKGQTNEPLLAEQNALLKEMLVALKARDEPTGEQRNGSQELRQVAEALTETNALLKQVAETLTSKAGKRK